MISWNGLKWNAETGYTGYTGELGDATAGVWNFYARSYDPMAATWLHADPSRGDLGNPQTLGRYGYVGNNPVTATDLLGYAINRLVDGEWGHRNAYRQLYKQQQEAKPRPPELPRTNNPFKPLPRTPSAESSRFTSATHAGGTLALPLTWLAWMSKEALAAFVASMGVAALLALGGAGSLLLIFSMSGDSSTARGDAEARANSDAAASTPASPNPEPDCDPAALLVCPENGEWANAQRARGHFDKHGAEFGVKSESQYTAMARQFYQNRGNYQVKTDSFGNVRVYDPKTNTFGSYGPDGTIRTFFKPTSPSYWSRQPGS